ncbi:MAG TPA: DNA recombination protein RmuC [Thermoanaerobaculia bacterium]
MTMVFCVIALVAGAVVGWMAASAGKQRAIAERDLAVVERQRADVAAADARRRLEAATQARVAAETKLAAVDEDKFVALASRAFERLGESLVQMNKTQVDGSLDSKKAEFETLLKPLRDMIEGYRGEVLKSERSRAEAYGGLQEQIRALLGAQESAQREASRLANALQSPTVRGSWGESSLKRCVELAGMSEFCDFYVQETFAGDDGRRLRPDLIVRLPNNRVIAVDAKVPLSDYQTAADEADDAKKRELLQSHARTMRRHIDTLSRRDYQSAVGETLDFTVMFLPGEHFLSAGLVTDPALFEYAVEKKIYLASPTVLLPLLRAVAAGWKAERTEENARRMHEAGVDLFNRFVKVMDYIAELGGAIGKSVDKYNEMIRSIDTRLWPKGQELQRMSGSGKNLEPLEQIDAVPLESSKLRLTMQQEEPAEVVPFRD